MRLMPDAKFIFLHRDPVQSVASLMSLRWLSAVQLTDQPLRAPIRDMTLDLCETMACRCMDTRDEYIPSAQRLDIAYEEMNRDWQGVMRRIYSFISMEFLSSVKNNMNRLLNENKHNCHNYRPEDFGSSAGEIGERMQFYGDWIS